MGPVSWRGGPTAKKPGSGTTFWTLIWFSGTYERAPRFGEDRGIGPNFVPDGRSARCLSHAPVIANNHRRCKPPDVWRGGRPA